MTKGSSRAQGIAALIMGALFIILSIGISKQIDQCGGEVMKSGDTCMHFTNGGYSGDFNYDRQTQYNSTISAIIGIIGTAFCIAGIGLLIYSANKPKESTLQPPNFVPPSMGANKRAKSTLTTGQQVRRHPHLKP